MFDTIEEEIEALEKMYEAGKIDKTIYDQEMARLTKIVGNRKNDNNGTKKINIRIVFLLIIIVLLIWFFIDHIVIKNTEFTGDFNNIPAPIQKTAKGSDIQIIDGGGQAKINYVASYNICGRVVKVNKYYSFDIGDKLSPRDVGLSWGPLAREENHTKVKWSYGNRVLYWSSTDVNWVNQMGGTRKIGEYWSNNHLIPSDDNTKKLVNAIKEGDYVRIEGYLVNVYCKLSNNSYFTWNSSTTRTDSGNHACEVLYVTNVTWLKEKK